LFPPNDKGTLEAAPEEEEPRDVGVEKLIINEFELEILFFQLPNPYDAFFTGAVVDEV
jgi:hypothetical protein